MKKSIYSDVLREHDYMQYLTASVISRFGDSLDAIAYSWIMYEVTKNASLIAFIMALNYLPSICFQPFLAVFAERMEKKKVVAVTSLGRGAIVLCTAFLYMTGGLSGFYLMAATLLTSTLEAFSLPSGAALVPKLLPAEKITEAQSLSAFSSSLAELIGVSVAGSIIALFGAHSALFIDFLTFAVSALLILFLPYRETLVPAVSTITAYKTDLLEGVRSLLSDRLLLGVIAIGMSMNAVLVPLSSFQSIFIADYLHLDAQALSFFSATLSVGMLAGSAVAPKLKALLGARRVVVLSGLLFSGFYLVEAFVPVLVLSRAVLYGLNIAVFLLLGLGLGSVSVLFGALFIEAVDQAYMARISGITNALLTAMMPLVALLCSLLAVVLRVNWIFLLVGSLNLFIYLCVARAKLFRPLDAVKTPDPQK